MLVLGGLGFLAILGYATATEGWNSNFGAWMSLGVALILILVGWYYLRLDLDTLDHKQPPSRLTRFCVVHRRELTAFADTGAVFCYPLSISEQRALVQLGRRGGFYGL